jgi:hypothetical protein
VNGFAGVLLATLVTAGPLFGVQKAKGTLPNPTPGTRHETSYKYQAAGTKLHGRLVQRQLYGPPGYGETPQSDAKVSIFVLKLAEPISVEPAAHADENHGLDSEPVKDVREVQLFLGSPLESEGHMLIDKAHVLIGHEITATGSLSESITASQYTKVLLDVTALDPK